MNANLLSVWRRLYRQGLLTERASSRGALLPVKVATPTVIPTERVTAPRTAEKEPAHIEVEFARGQRLRMRGPMVILNPEAASMAAAAQTTRQLS